MEVFDEVGERGAVVFEGKAEEALEDQGGDPGVAGGGVAVVGDDAELGAEAVEGEVFDGFLAGEGAVAFEVEREVHGVEAGVGHCEAVVAFVGGVEGFDVVADVVADDDAVAKVGEKLLQGFWLIEASEAFFALSSVERARHLNR